MNKRMVLPDKRKIRNLKQYQDLTDEEFEEQFSDVLAQATVTRGLEERIVKKLEDMAKDYDMEDMKSNDMVQLRALAQAEIQLEDLEGVAYQLRQEVSTETVVVLEKVNNIMSKLRNDISMIQQHLMLTRKIRKESKEASVVSYIDTIKEKAKKFYRNKMLYLFCPECRYLLSTIWLLYPENENSISLTCSHCGHKFNATLASLYSRKNNANLDDVELP